MLVPGLLWVFLVFNISLAVARRRTFLIGITIGVLTGLLLSWYIKPAYDPPWLHDLAEERGQVIQK